ncbi:MAG: hypothetical protein ACNYWM_01775 [Methanosarcinales archaeon]
MAISRHRAKTKRYIKEMIHRFRFTYEDISENTGIDVDRLKAINKSEEPTREEVKKIGDFTVNYTIKHTEEDGE